VKPRNLPGRICLAVLAMVCTTALHAAAQDPPPPGRSASSQPSQQATPAHTATRLPLPAASSAYSTGYANQPQSPSPPRQISPIQISAPRASGETFVSYPSNWAEICRRQERYGAMQRMEDPPTREARRRFNATVPEISFETGVTLADAIERIRRDSGINIFVNWPALQQYGVTRDQEVTLPKMTAISWRKITELLLQQVNSAIGGVTQLDWALEGGVLTISTRDDLSTSLTTRVYDIGDLLVPRMVVQPGTASGLTGQAGGSGGTGATGGTGASGGTSSGTTGGFGG
jgi:uncharacterized membrane protein YgcG